MAKRLFKIIRIAILVLCVAVFLFSVGMLVKIIIGYIGAEKTYDDINDRYEEMVGVDTEVLFDEGEAPERLVKLSAYVRELKGQYPDVIGYVNVPSLGISYPVVQTDNNDFYLDHMVNGEESTSGAIFLDCRIDKNPLVTKNTVLYGHNMNNGSMFHKVVDLFNKDEFLKATVEYVTEDAVFIYRPFALYRAEAYYPFFMWEFSSDEGFLDFCDMILEKSFHTENGGVEYNEASGIITFSTCTNSIASTTGRYIYHGIMAEAYTDVHKEQQ